MEEQWKWISGYEGCYEISNMGRCRSYMRKHKPGYVLKPTWIEGNNGNRYHAYMLCVDNFKRTLSAGQLVAKAFIPNPNGYEQVAHLNFDRTDNRVENLKWVDAANNVRRYYGTKWVATHKDTGERVEANSRRHLASLIGVSYGQIMYALRTPGRVMKSGYIVTTEEQPKNYNI
jgi:hypothetical protein